MQRRRAKIFLRFRRAAATPRLWLRARDGVTAVEFALVAAPTLFLFYAIFQIGLYFFMERSLEHATLVAARAVTTGAVTVGALTASQFEATYICPNLPGLFNCSNVFIQLTVVTPNQSPSGYYAYVNPAKSGLILPPLNSKTDTFSSGTSCQYVVLQVLYPQPYFFSGMTASNATVFNGQSVSVLMASTTFKSEPYSGSASAAGC